MKHHVIIKKSYCNQKQQLVLQFLGLVLFLGPDFDFFLVLIEMVFDNMYKTVFCLGYYC
jgi:hypothetical protein